LNPLAGGFCHRERSDPQLFFEAAVRFSEARAQFPSDGKICECGSFGIPVFAALSEYAVRPIGALRAGILRRPAETSSARRRERGNRG
jgi:hypothetical protein